MVSPRPIQYQELRDYAEAYEAMRVFYVKALRDFYSSTPNTFKNQILRNFVSSAIVRLDSILRLYAAGNYDDCWILHRALVDRFVHLRSLVRNDDFDEFERWSFQRQFRDADAALSHPQVASRFAPDVLRQARELHKERQARINLEAKSTWKRPHAKQELSGQPLSVLFIGGYNFASTKVHPMADDGKDDFSRLVMQAPNPQAKTIEVVHNSFAIFLLILNEWFRSKEVLWRSFVETFYSKMLEFLENGSKEYLTTCSWAQQLGQDFSWCEANSEE